MGILVVAGRGAGWEFFLSCWGVLGGCVVKYLPCLLEFINQSWLVVYSSE